MWKRIPDVPPLQRVSTTNEGNETTILSTHITSDSDDDHERESASYDTHPILCNPKIKVEESRGGNVDPGQLLI